MLRIAEIMTPAPVTIATDTPLADCGRTMRRLRLRHLLVCDPEHKILGAISDHQVFSKGGFAGAHGELWVPLAPEGFTQTAGELPLETVSTIAPEETVLSGLRQLIESPGDFIVAVDARSRPLGIVTEHDVARLAAVGLDVHALVPAASSAPLISVSLDTTAAEALTTMWARRVRHLVVLDEGQLAGVLSVRDLLSENVHPKDPRSVDAVLLRRDVLTASGPTSLREAAERMVRHKVGCLPVLSPRGRPVGILTRVDLAQALLAQLETAARVQED